MRLPSQRATRIGLRAYVVLTIVVMVGLLDYLTSRPQPVDDNSAPTEQTGADQAVVDSANPDDPGPVTLGDRIDEPGALVASVIPEGVYAFAEPGATEPLGWFPNPTQFGGRRVFLVADNDREPDWVEIELPTMPNGQRGWVQRDKVEIEPIYHRIDIDLATNQVTLRINGAIVMRSEATVGAQATPTPTGTFYVRDLIARTDADGPYGSNIVALSGFSEVLETFDGGLPALAVHGTGAASVTADGGTNGCIRVDNDAIRILAGVPLGTPVTITG